MKFEGYSMPLHEEEDKYQKLFEETNTYHYNGICSSSDDELYRKYPLVKMPICGQPG